MPPIPIATAVDMLRTSLQTQLGWGESAGWSNYDFEQLSEQVSEKTGVTLSVSTLKRILGKVDYKNTPSLTTLNTLSQFLGHADWREFQKQPEPGESQRVNEIADTPAPPNPVKTKHWLKLMLSGIILIGLVSFLVFRKTSYTPVEFQFSSKTMFTEGLPNSVVFDFDATKANQGDSIFISQSWDLRRKVLVSKNDKYHSAIYYYPGYYRAKLMVGEQIVKEHDIRINTKGWLGATEAEWGREPIYFDSSEIVQGQTVKVSSELLKKYQVPTSPSVPKILLFNQQKFEGIMTDNFTFETEVKIENLPASGSCQRIEVLVQAVNDIMIIPLVNPRCIGDIYVVAYGHYAQSQSADLSGFGCHPTEWTRLKVTCNKGSMKFFIDEKEVYQARMTSPPAEIVGVQFRFSGPGAIRNTGLQGAEGKVSL